MCGVHMYKQLNLDTEGLPVPLLLPTGFQRLYHLHQFLLLLHFHPSQGKKSEKERMKRRV